MVNLRSIKRSMRKNMAVEKLTKKRLIQILIMLIILLIAFSYRTIYQKPLPKKYLKNQPHFRHGE